MQFGKQILAQQVPGWSAYYLDYKSLKKIVSSLASGRHANETAVLAIGTRSVETNQSSPELGTTAQSIVVEQSQEIQDDRNLAFFSVSGRDEDRGPTFQALKTSFFFKLERELEKVCRNQNIDAVAYTSLRMLQINAFYLQKEAELKLRLETLLSKRKAAAERTFPDKGNSTPKDNVEWRAVEEGLRLLERDLAKLQV